MKLIIVQNYQELSIEAANLVTQAVKDNPRLVLGLATGSTPEGMYRELVSRYKEGLIDFAQAVTFNLDEYLGLAPGHRQSYHYYMQTKFISQVNLKPENVHIPSGLAADPALECSSYERKINQAGGIDLQVLGVGPNGHIGFNEPADALTMPTHLAELTHDTIRANSRFFAGLEEVPKKALTMGMGAIMAARQIVLLAAGFNKAYAVQNLVSGALTTAVPVSILKLHPALTVITDFEAACLVAR